MGEVVHFEGRITGVYCPPPAEKRTFRIRNWDFAIPMAVLAVCWGAVVCVLLMGGI